MKKPARRECQERAFDYAIENPYSIIALDPRLGKSRVIIDLREKFQNNCLIICPSQLVLNWVDQIRLWAPPDVQITVVQKGKDIYEICDTDYAIISYDLAQKAENFFDWADMIAIDEGHNIQNMEAKRTQYIHKSIFEYAIKRMHPLTGSPLKNRVKEFYSLLALTYYDPRVADPEFLRKFPTEIDFADHFSHRKEYSIEINKKFVTVVKWEGLKNVKELKKWLKGKYIRIKAEDVQDLPPVMEKPILISNTPDKELLRAFKDYFVDDQELNEDEDNADDDYYERRQKRTSSVLPEHKAMAALKKAPFTIRYVENLLQEVKCVCIYSDHVEAAEAIAKHFDVVALTGKISSGRRAQISKQFQNGEGKVLVATVRALKEGRDLWRANDIILNDLPWVPGDIKQVINRIRAIGKKSPCMVHRIFGSPQDAYISMILTEKMKVIDQAT